MKAFKNKDSIITMIGVSLLLLLLFTDGATKVIADGTGSTETEWQEEVDSETEVSEEASESEEVIPETEVILETEEVPETEAPAFSWVTELEVSKETTQLLLIEANGTYATVSLHTQNDKGIWVENFSVTGRVGKNGIGKTTEGDGKTPTGKYQFNKAFGILPDPGISVLAYLQVDESYHWVDDSNSQYYNQCVSTDDVEVDWTSSEALYATGQAYNYALAINYNEECVPGLGSAIFLHCPSADFGATAGCIAIPEENMIQIMQLLQPDCMIIIDAEQKVMEY